jgi:drug/metabolite transporter (DMT)-like permease
VKGLDIFELTTLGALWGGSFLFMRVAAPEFGPVALVSVRVGVAVALLLPCLAWMGRLPALATHARPLAIVGVINSAVPFCLFAFATLSLSAGFTAVINAMAPLFTAIIALLWLGVRPGRLAAVGLLLGVVGVTVLVRDKLSLTGDAVTIGILGALSASLCYGIAANYTRVALTGVGSLEIATGSQLAAAALLLPLSLWFWPAQMPSARAWFCAVALGLACTGLAYILYFRLIARLGPARAVTVTFLVPMAAMVFGALFLDEQVTAEMLAGCALILLGTALATGLIKPGRTDEPAAVG